MIRNLYQPVNGEIVDIIKESSTIKSFVVVLEETFKFETGQFVELTLPGVGEAPFTPSSLPSEDKNMEITIKKVGHMTALLHDCEKGQKIGIRGPYGNGYPIDDFIGKDIYIIGEGIGIATIRSLFLTLVSRMSDFNSVVCRFGAKTPDDFIYKNNLFDSWHKIDGVDIQLTIEVTNGSWDGNIGVVTTILSSDDVNISNAAAIVCGPPVMMKFSTLKLLEYGFRPEQIYLSMTKNMSCGVGKCGHCMMGKYYICKDGPVFTYERVKGLPDIWG